MRVLVTRAREDAARTARRLVAAGHDAVLSPLIDIVGTGAAVPNDPVDAILATSVHALIGVDRLPSALTGAPWLVVGTRLADALRERGFGEAEAVAPDVAALIAAIAARYPEPFRFLVLAGRDRKPDLERALAAAGHEVVIVETYAARARDRFELPVEAALRKGEIDVALHFSERGAGLFVAALELARIDASELRHVAISPGVAAVLAAQGWSATSAASPDEAGVIAALPS